MQDENKNSELEASVEEEIPTESDFSFDEDDYEYEAAEPELEDAGNSAPDEQASDELLSGDTMVITTVASRKTKGVSSRQDLQKQKAKAEKSKKRGDFWKKARLPLIIAGFVILGIAVGLFVYSLSTIDENRVMKNVYIEDLDVGGLTYDETLAAVNSTYLFENSEITITNGEVSYQIIGADIGLSAMPEETAKKAFDYCKDGNIFQNGFHAFMLLIKPEVIVPAPQVDTEKLDEKLNEFGNIALGERIQHYVAFDDSTVAVVYSGQTGYNGDPSEAREQVLTAMENEQFKDIAVTLTSAPPDDMTIEMIDLLIYKDPVDARYEVNGNEVSIVQSETGRYINKEEVAPILPSIYEGCEPVGVPFYVSEPEVTAELLQERLFANTLSSYSTSYGGSTANRSANVARAASLINGTVVAPGAVFSFNDTVGHRTTANGFYTAKEYINGESVDGIGGGTCQVSSTLYSAVLYADLGIVERLNHMMSVGYIPLGQDATVSDGGVDFQFRNTSDYPIKISAYTTGSTITVSIIGTAWNPSREVKISNTSSMVGENTVVRSTRYVYSNGELISTDTLNSSTYMPHKQAVVAEASSSSASSYDTSENSSEDYSDTEDYSYDSEDDDSGDEE